MSPLKNSCVVVPVDLSDESIAAVGTGLECAGDASNLRVIHVLRDVTTADLEHMWDEVDQSRWQSKARAALEQRLSDEKYRGATIEVAFGDPGETITHYARREHADLIVIPSHGRRGLSRWLLGSVADRVIRLAHCPVLVLKRDEED